MTNTKNTLWIATHNKGKIKEFETLMKGWPFKLKSISKKVKAPEETGTTFEENALIKLKAYSQKNSWILTEDSGIEVESLGGKPGVHSARYQGKNSTWIQKIDGLLKAMKGIENRKAQMVSFICLQTPEGKIIKSKGVIKGEISKEIQGFEGFAYDFVFIPKGENQTLAGLGIQYKNKHSHRAQAVLGLQSQINSYF